MQTFLKIIRYFYIMFFQSNMNSETGEPLDTLNPDILKWTKSIGSNAKTVTDVINSRDPLVS